MANTKLTPQERLAKLEQQEAEIKAQADEKLSQLKARKKAILAREKAAEEKRVKAELYKEYNTPERRARTRRLIEIGGQRQTLVQTSFQRILKASIIIHLNVHDVDVGDVHRNLVINRVRNGALITSRKPRSIGSIVIAGTDIATRSGVSIPGECVPDIFESGSKC